MTYDDLLKLAASQGYKEGEGDVYHNINPSAGLGTGYTYSGLPVPGGKAVMNQDGSFVWADPNKNGWNQGITSDGKTFSYEQKNGIDPLMFAPLAATGLAAALAPATAGAGTAASAGGYAIPTAEELSAAGFDVGGMGMTGADGIGAASSVAGSGAGAAGYGGMGGLSGIDSALSMPDYANESTKLLQQQALADSGMDLLPTDLQFTPSSGANNLWDSIKSALTPSNISKIATALKGSTGGASHAGPSSSVGGGGVFNQIANETPGMIAAANPIQQQQSQIPAFLLANPDQPKVSSTGYFQIPEVASQNPQMLKLAQALQQG